VQHLGYNDLGLCNTSAITSYIQWYQLIPQRARVFLSGFGDLGVSVLAAGTQVRGFKPGRSCRIFKGGQILSTPSFGREVKPWVPCRRFVASKRTLNVLWKSAFRQNYRSLFPPISSNFRR
jgi:hypothetical protein